MHPTDELSSILRAWGVSPDHQGAAAACYHTSVPNLQRPNDSSSFALQLRTMRQRDVFKNQKQVYYEKFAIKGPQESPA